MTENQKKSLNEQMEAQEQAQIWAKDSSDFKQFNNQLQQDRNKMFKAYQGQVLNQIQQNQKANHNQNEAFEIQENILKNKLKDEVLQLKKSIYNI